MNRFICLALFVVLIGCTKKVSSKLASYEIGAPPVQQVVRTSGTYEIKWVDERGKKHHRVEMSGVKLKQGDTVGFGTGDDGHVIALAGDMQIDLPSLPEQAKHCIWYHKTRQETQFAKDLRSAGLMTGDFASMMASESIWQGMGLEASPYTFTRDKKGNMRLKPDYESPQPRKAWNYYDEQDRLMNGGR